MYAAGLTAVGLVREHNEDAIRYTMEPVGPLPNLFIVADGMGGHNAGEVASQKSVEFFYDFVCNAAHTAFLKPDDILSFMLEATHTANQKVYEYAAQSPDFRGMGTTFSACTILNNSMIYTHIGDSRIYAISPGHITRVTLDHTFVEELVKQGSLTPEQAKTHPRRNQLTRVLGCDPDVFADGAIFDISHVDSILLCSDGLSDMVPQEAVLKLVSLNVTTDARVQALIDTANNQGGIDNISAIIIDVKGEAH